MEKRLTQHQISDYDQNGIVKLPGIVDDNLLEKLNQCFDWSVANPGPIAVGKPTGENISFIDNGNPAAYEMYSDLVLESGFGHVAAELWNSKYVGFFAEEIFFKKGKSRPTYWHQDTVYSPWGGEHWANFWIPLVSMTAEQSIRIVRGSHKGIMYDGTTFNPTDPTEPLWGEAGDFPRLPDITSEYEANPASWDIVGFDVSPGDIVVLHPHALHAGGKSDANFQVRRNLVLRFFGDKSHYSAHLPDAPGMYNHKPIPATGGGFLADGDPYRPASMIQANV